MNSICCETTSTPYQSKYLISTLLIIWQKIKYPMGYLLFATTVGYGIWHAPDSIWNLKPLWLLLSIGVVLLVFLLQLWQLRIFLHAHNVTSQWLYPALFNARKGILNTILPARSGTLLLIHSLTKRHAIKWLHFLHFFLLASFISLYVSGLALAWLLLPWIYSTILILASFGLSYIIAGRDWFRYSQCLPSLLLIAFGLYITTAAVFFCLLRGLGYTLDIMEISYFAITLNVLSQISITPGNMGVREVVMGMLASYVALPISVGILASSLLLVLRLTVYGAILGCLEWLSFRTEQINSDTGRS